MSNKSKSAVRKSLISGLILIAVAVAVSGAAFAGVITGEIANIILPVLVAGTVVYNVIFLAREKNDSVK